jgi:hypothetical protein
MYLQSTITNPQEILTEATRSVPFGAGFSKELAESADKMEVWCSSFNDNDEFCEFKLYKKNQIIAKRRIDGY